VPQTAWRRDQFKGRHVVLANCCVAKVNSRFPEQ
jgi:hypothetical protein